MIPFIIIMILISIISFVVIAIVKKKYSKNIAIASTLLNLIITLAILANSILLKNVSLTEQYQYISSLGVTFGFQLNIISLVLLVMSSIVLFATALSGNTENEHLKLSSALVIVFQIASIGLFTASNFFLFFIFWDIGVIALFLMINTLGSANRKAASINFLIYEILASSLLFLAIILLYVGLPAHSLNFQYLISNAMFLPMPMQLLIFFLLFVAFMINMPIFPMHFWLPDAHTEASTQGSMILSGIMTKFGAFGMLLLFSMMPIASKFSPYIAILAIISVFYSAFLLINQKDLKRIIAYSTIVEMGIILIGISALNNFGTYGAVYAMLSHGLAISLMFLVVGIIKHIFGERNIEILKGTVINGSTITYVFMIGILTMVGFPLTSGFIADILLFIGAFQSFGIYGLLPLLALIIIGAYMYFVISKSMLSGNESLETVDYVKTEQKIGYSIIIFFIFLFGILPFIILNLVKL